MSEEKIAEMKYDVYLCYNPGDESSVKKIGNQLRERKITPWLYNWDIRPGTSRQNAIEQQIEYNPAAVIFFGKAGIDSGQKQEIYAWLLEFSKRNCPVIPVLLEDAPDE